MVSLKKLKLHIICCIPNVPQHVDWWTHTFPRPLFYIHLNVLGFAHSGTTSNDLEAIALNVMHFNFTVANLQKALSIWLQMEKMHTADSIASTHRTGLALKLTLSQWKSARLCLTCSFPSTTSGPTWAQWLGKSYHATVKAPSTRDDELFLLSQKPVRNDRPYGGALVLFLSVRPISLTIIA